MMPMAVLPRQNLFAWQTSMARCMRNTPRAGDETGLRASPSVSPNTLPIHPYKHIHLHMHLCTYTVRGARPSSRRCSSHFHASEYYVRAPPPLPSHDGCSPASLIWYNHPSTSRPLHPACVTLAPHRPETPACLLPSPFSICSIAPSLSLLITSFFVSWHNPQVHKKRIEQP